MTNSTIETQQPSQLELILEQLQDTAKNNIRSTVKYLRNLRNTVFLAETQPPAPEPKPEPTPVPDFSDFLRDKNDADQVLRPTK